MVNLLSVELEKGIFKIQIPQRCSILIEASAGLGADILAISFLAQEILKNNNVFIVTATKSYEQIRKEFEMFSISESALKRKLLLATTSKEDFPNVYYINLSELFTISNIIKRFLTNSHMGFIDIFSPLLVLEKASNVFLLLQTIIDAVHASLGSIFITVDPYIAEKKSIALFESLSDIVIEMKEEVRGFQVIRGLRIKKIIGGAPTKFYEYTISKNGILIGDPLE